MSCQAWCPNERVRVAGYPGHVRTMYLDKDGVQWVGIEMEDAVGVHDGQTEVMSISRHPALAHLWQDTPARPPRRHTAPMMALLFRMESSGLTATLSTV